MSFTVPYLGLPSGLNVYQRQLNSAWRSTASGAGRARVLQTIIDSMPAPVDGEARPRLELPHGNWTLDDHDGDGIALLISKPVLLSLGGSRLEIPVGVTAIAVAPGGEASYASIQDGAIAYPSPPATDDEYACVLIQAHGVRVSNLRTTYGGYGIFVDGQDDPEANACMVRDCAIFGARVGVRTAGGDANAGIFSGIEINGDGLTSEIGFQDDSFLGNTFIGCHVATVSEHAYICSQGANYSSVVGMYIEANCGYNLPGGFDDCVSSQARVTFLGGGAVLNVNVGDRVGQQQSRLGFRGPLTGGGSMQVTIPDIGRNAAWTMERITDEGLVEEGASFRYVDSLTRVGLHVFTGSGYEGEDPVADNGITMPLGYLSSRAVASPLTARVNASEANNDGFAIPEPP